MGYKVYEVDIHGEERDYAIRKVQKLLSTISNDYGEMRVIHGYRQGSVLQKAIRTQLKHKRIKRRMLTLNQGETTLILNKL